MNLLDNEYVSCPKLRKKVMRDTEFSKFLSKCQQSFSKVFCCRSRTAVESNFPSDIPSRTRRRRHSPEPRRMVVNMNQNQNQNQNENAEPKLVEIVNVDLETIHQRAQFEDPNEVVWDICWDSFRETPVILCGRDGPNRMVDCSNANKRGWQVTVKDVMKMLGYELDYDAPDGIRLANVFMSNLEMEVRDMVEMTVENMPLSHFELNIEYYDNN